VDGLTIRVDQATAREIEDHLFESRSDFMPPLGERVDIPAYARKLERAAATYEAWRAGSVVGLIALYRDDDARTAFISNVSVSPPLRARGVARLLLGRVLEDADAWGYRSIQLEVDPANLPALRLYRHAGFQTTDNATVPIRMTRNLSQAFPEISDKGLPSDS
jgi:ribosomal protein S18 acetylase RimI-like enzyme